MKAFTAFEIKTRTEWDIMVAIDPHFNELSFDENIGNFIVFGFVEPKRGRRTAPNWAIMTPATVGTHFDHIENGPRIQLKNLVK